MANAMVWGGEGGIGAALVHALIVDGWEVASIARKTGSSEATVALEADVSNLLQVEQAMLEVAQTLDEIELWVYAVGDIAGGRISNLPSADWDRVIGANLTGAYHAIKGSLPLITNDAHIVFIGALPANILNPGLSAYAAAKAGLEAFAAVLAKEEPQKRVTVLRPGPVVTPLWAKIGAKPPRSAVDPAAVAAAIIAAHRSGQSGVLDL